MTGVPRLAAASALRGERSQWIIVLCALAGLTLAATLLTRAVVNDDPYITYRYARNLAGGAGFTYNSGEPVLSTTAPLYALLLAGLAALGIDPPAASLLAGSLSAFAASALLYRLGLRAGQARPALIAAVLLASSPLVWLATGLESSLYLALALGAFNAAADRRWGPAGLLAALAALTRGDGLLVVGLIIISEGLQRRSLLGRSLLSASALIVPALILATIAYGSPVPATLRAKTLQASLGITGLFPFARFLDGLPWLAAAYLEQSWLYVLMLPLAAIGLGRIREQRWLGPIVAWGALQLIGYTVLGVAPYRWYYVPLLPAVYGLIGLGIVGIARRAASRSRTLLGLGLALALLAAQARSLWEIQRSTDPGIPESELIGSNALPNTSGALYRQVGAWLRDNTPHTASVGVMEVGVIGYYAERRMIDYLGLLQPEVAAALGRRDIFWSIPHLLPDYLVLTAINPLYDYDLRADAWFQASYAPVTQFGDGRFWGSPITIYARRAPAADLATQPVDLTIGALQLTGYAIELIPIWPGIPIRIRLEWARPSVPGARVSVGLIGAQGEVIAAGERTYNMATWPASGGSVYHTMVAGPNMPPGVYRALITVETEGRSEHAFVGKWVAPLGEVRPPSNLTPLAARFGDAIDLIGYTLDPNRPGAGAEVSLTLYWRARRTVERDYTVFVHLEAADGRLILAADSQPRAGSYPTSIWSPGDVIDDRHTFRIPDNLPAGDYSLKMGLYLLDSGQRLTTGEADQVHLTTLTIR
jgi:4-amino-4-deoxy-L-arabinose transferase-like glycosyltransferase